MAALQITNEGEQKQQLDKALIQAVEEHGIKGVISSAQCMTAHVHTVTRSTILPRGVAAR